MWLSLAFISAALLGLYDVCKKQSLKNNAVIPVLFLNTLFSSLIFLPLIIISLFNSDLLIGNLFFIPSCGWEVHKYILIKSYIVLGSWIFGYLGIKHLPITIVGPINTMRPVLVLVGAIIIFGEKLNFYQWIGVMLAVLSFYLLNKSGMKEGINFRKNKWIYFIILSGILGAASGLYDKFLFASIENGGININRMAVQSWYNIYQSLMMGVVLLVLWYPDRKSAQFHWSWYIICISVFLTAADFVYFYCLSIDGAMISVISMVRRSSVVVSFFAGGFIFREKNLKDKFFDLVLVLISMVFLYYGSR